MEIDQKQQILSHDSISTFGISKVYRGEIEDPYVSLDFHKEGEFAVCAKRGGQIDLINCNTGNVQKSLYAKKCGIQSIKMTNSTNCVLYSSVNDTMIRYHSLYDNRVLCAYTGHEKEVTSISKHPTADEFLSSSKDGTVRLWDLQAPGAIAVIKTMNHLSHCPNAVFDPDGAIFAAYTDDANIRLYDTRNYALGPFAKFSICKQDVLENLKALDMKVEMHAADKDQDTFRVTKMEFSPDGKLLAVMTNIGVCIALDSYSGDIRQVFKTANVTRGIPLGFSFSGDGQFVAMGCESGGGISIFDVVTAQNITAGHDVFGRGHIGPVTDIQWNPSRAMLATLHCNTIFWSSSASSY